MRIAYITPYQGPELIKRRPVMRNLSLAGNVKIGMIAELLQQGSHEVEVLSQGEVIERQFKYYPGFSEALPPAATVYYGSALPVRYVNGFWASHSLKSVFKARHRAAPFDVAIIYNLKPPQVVCANYAQRRLGLPVILEYNDDCFSDIWGRDGHRFTSKYYRSAAKQVLGSIQGGLGCTPYLMAQMPAAIPKFLSRGVVSSDIAENTFRTNGSRKNWVVFSGTLERTQGIADLIEAWQNMALPDWVLHIAGRGPIAGKLEEVAGKNPNIVFHGMLNKKQLAALLCQARIGMNPQDVTKIPGNTFPFKIVEYLAAGLHVISTPRGKAEVELEAGITYMPDNSAGTIAAALQKVIGERIYEKSARDAALKIYGRDAVSNSLETLLKQVMAASRAGK